MFLWKQSTMRLSSLGFLAVFASLVAGGKYDNSAKCCSDTKLNVHLVCHTHDDVGWLKTVDQYYLGSNNSIQYILDSMTVALEQDPNKKFTYVEQAFFTRWWNEQSADKQARVRKLVDDGQLVFTNGGWCMHDEATAHYVGMIDQTTVGHRFIAETFGEKALPRVGWQIDPFGHSSTQAALLSGEVGFDALYFGRIDYQDMDVRKAHKQLEFLWDASPSLGPSAGVFTGIFPSGNYGPPPGFCFDQFCNDEPINDDTVLHDVNVQARVDQFVSRVMDLKAFYDGNNIMLQMGSDFQYENAAEWFKNLDKLIHYVNKDGRLNVFYSTPIEYTEARHDEKLAFGVKRDDFFPYADGEHMYWTGYFTSRPALKRLERVTSGFLQGVRQLEALALLSSGSPATSSLGRFEEAQAVVQHHDAVAGTAKQHVTYDYAQRLDIGYSDAEAVASSSLASLLGLPSAKFAHCKLLNESVCAFTQQATSDDQPISFQVVVYNPLVHVRSSPVRLPISTPAYTVYFGEEEVPCDVITTEASPDSNAAPYTLVFQATHVPPVGIKTYLVKLKSGEDNELLRVPRRPTQDEQLVIANQHVSLTFDKNAGRLVGMSRKDGEGVEVSLSQDFVYYKAHNGSDMQGQGQPAGAYIFRPTDDQARLQVSNSPATLEVIKGAVVTEVRQTFSKWVRQTVRLYDDANHAELEWTVGPIPVEDLLGKDVVSLFSSDVRNNRDLYTDSNAREFIARSFNSRGTWNLTVNEPVAGNYYPVNAAAYIKDAKAQLSLLVDRSQGVGSLRDGELEVMVHRRGLVDDRRGVGEPLNETDGGITHGDAIRIGDGVIVRGKHLLLLSEPKDAIAEVRSLMDEAFLPVSLLFTSDETVQASPSLTAHLTLTGGLPPQVALLTLRKLSQNKALVRLSHQYAVGEDPVLSKPATVDMSSLFGSLDVEDVTELTLTGGMPKAHAKRLQWQSTEGGVIAGPRPSHDPSPVSVTLGPMEIRTFEVSFKYDLPPPPATLPDDVHASTW